ncbi:UNVERIFIED_CONTAM: hypothetical protein RMT77_016654 [Armadillidium vulgare]|nr:Small nuclear ribonucleoprotein Sm D3 [Armadillidium vulgare]
MSVGVPIKVLQEAEGHTVTVETKLGETFKGKLVEAEDNMNVQLEACIATYSNGKVSNMENVFIRGSKVKLIALPDFLKNAPMFSAMKGRRGGGTGYSALRGGRGRGGRGHSFNFGRGRSGGK